jgi:hypothetical protein
MKEAGSGNKRYLKLLEMPQDFVRTFSCSDDDDDEMDETTMRSSGRLRLSKSHRIANTRTYTN